VKVAAAFELEKARDGQDRATTFASTKYDRHVCWLSTSHPHLLRLHRRIRRRRWPRHRRRRNRQGLRRRRSSSTEATFPVAVGPDLTFNGGYNDAFVCRVNAAGTHLDYCGFIVGRTTRVATESRSMPPATLTLRLHYLY